MDFSKELAGNIRAVRARADLSRAEVASKLGVNVSIFAKYKSGDYIPGTDKLLAISQVLGFPPNDLMGWNTDETAWEWRKRDDWGSYELPDDITTLGGMVIFELIKWDIRGARPRGFHIPKSSQVRVLTRFYALVPLLPYLNLQVSSVFDFVVLTGQYCHN